MTLLAIKPLTITPAMLKATDVPETDYAEWAVGTTYAIGARVIVSAQHKIYQSLVAGNVGNSPVTASDKWGEVSATNRWKAFDLVRSSQTAKSGSLYFEITPGVAINAVGALNLVGATSIRIRLTDPTYGLLYDKTTTLTTVPAYASWYDWFFGDRVETPQYVAIDIPSLIYATLRVDFTGTSELAVGVLLLGQAKAIGDTRYGASVGIRDYSRKEANDYGDIVLTKRSFARTARFPVLVSNAEKARTAALLESLRATPTLWMDMTGDELLTVFGFYRDWSILVSYPTVSECELEIEGLT